MPNRWFCHFEMQRWPVDGPEKKNNTRLLKDGIRNKQKKSISFKDLKKKIFSIYSKDANVEHDEYRTRNK